MGIKINKSDDYDDPPAILKSLIHGLFMNVAMKQIDGTYKNIRGTEELHIHPSSVLCNIKPKFVMYSDIITTTKNFMREVSEIDIEWVLELAPHFYTDRRKEMHQEKYIAQSKLNHKNLKEEAKKPKEEKNDGIIKIPKAKTGMGMYVGMPNKKESKFSRKRVRRLELAPIPKDVKKDTTKLAGMFPNKKAKNNNLSFDGEDY